MTEKISINFDDLTLGDIEDVEEVIGKSFNDAITQKVVRDENGDPQPQTTVEAKAISALIWVIKRRDNPDFTIEDARAMKMVEIDFEADEVPPTGAAD